MNDLKNNMSSKNWPIVLKVLVMPLILLFIGVALSVYFYNEVSLLTFQYGHPIEKIQFTDHSELLRNDHINGEFVAPDNNLGAVAVYVTTFNRINTNVIAFELREKGAKDWYIFNKYFTQEFPNDQPFPFGFPTISDSKGKTYEFEIFSANGEPGNAVGFKDVAPYFFSRYTYHRSDVQGRSGLLSFMIKKFNNLLATPHYVTYLLLFIGPAFLYVVIYVKSKNRKSLLITEFPDLYALSLLVIYILIPMTVKTDIVWYLSLLILFTFHYFSKGASHLLMIALALLMLSPLWLFLHKEIIANRSAVMIYFLTGISLILLYKESRKFSKSTK